MDIDTTPALSPEQVARTRLRAAEAVGPAASAQPSRPTVSAPERLRIAVEWHAASLSYVHRILDPHTGQQIQQLPAAQVLDLVDDLMQQIRNG